ncbi:Hachiman antiphage defense system protein HamA [Atopobacter phocae]|uniref:Hachiman antiphage defense system protein HamA n=1 Tax=Atopobacter phocae TaxID=136492 RepID=UPI0004723040|nr:Hachiman antiphage defense system protein HamA [Atopobacter phocae]
MFFNNSQYFQFDKELISSNGIKANIFKLNNEIVDEEALNKWAYGMRNNYVEEHLLESLLAGTGLTKKQYLEQNVFPNPQNSQGAATMSGEFGEILVYDYINFVLEHYVSRTRYFDKINPDMPLPGTDVMGYKIQNISKPSTKDQLLVAEVKTRSSKTGKKMSLEDNPLGKAIIDSEKDRVRIGESLNAEKRRLLTRNRVDEAKIVERFQNKTDTPFSLNFYAVVIIDSYLYSDQFFLDVLNEIENKIVDKNILVIHSKELIAFLRDIYRRACIC